MTVSAVPPGWYPDPGAPHRWRYWNGSEWTEHVSEPAVTTADPVPSEGGEPLATEIQEEFVFTDEELGITPSRKKKRASRRKQYRADQTTTPTQDVPTGEPVWTRRTFMVLALCFAILITGIIGGISIVHHPYRTQVTEAENTLDNFLQATTTGNSAWMDYASAGMAAEFAVSSPFRGDPEVAQKMGLEVNYDIIDISLNSQRPTEAYFAKAYVELTLGFEHQGRDIVHETVQTVWLTRPFYEDGSVGVPDQLSHPDEVGEWKVTAISVVPHEEAKRSWPYPFKTTFHEQLGDMDEDPCLYVPQILEEISTSSREDSSARSQCFYGDTESFPGAEYLDEVGFTAGIPLITSLENETLPTDLMGIRGQLAGDITPEFLGTPLLQFRFQSSEGAYVMTMSVIQEDTYRSSYNIIRIDQVEVS